MTTPTPQETLWIERGMAFGRWLNKQFEALAHLGYRGFRQRLHDKGHRSSWQASAH